MTDKICCFAGHADAYLSDLEYQRLKNVIEKLITEENVFEFWIGNYGSFDALAARALRDIKKSYNGVKSFLVIPYLTDDIKASEEYYQIIYDGTIMADIAFNTPRKFMITRCNEYMVNHADYLVCYVRHSWGGAAKTLQYAKRRKKEILNIYEN